MVLVNLVFTKKLFTVYFSACYPCSVKVTCPNAIVLTGIGYASEKISSKNVSLILEFNPNTGKRQK